jgi:hypothetical protein
MLDKAKRELKRLEDAAPPDETPSDDFKDHVLGCAKIKEAHSSNPSMPW